MPTLSSFIELAQNKLKVASQSEAYDEIAVKFNYNNRGIIDLRLIHEHAVKSCQQIEIDSLFDSPIGYRHFHQIALRVHFMMIWHTNGITICWVYQVLDHYFIQSDVELYYKLLSQKFCYSTFEGTEVAFIVFDSKFHMLVCKIGS